MQHQQRAWGFGVGRFIHLGLVCLLGVGVSNCVLCTEVFSPNQVTLSSGPGDSSPSGAQITMREEVGSSPRPPCGHICTAKLYKYGAQGCGVSPIPPHPPLYVYQNKPTIHWGWRSCSAGTKPQQRKNNKKKQNQKPLVSLLGTQTPDLFLWGSLGVVQRGST